MTEVTLEGTQELMRCRDIGVILATGGIGLVRAAYSSGKPAYGVGPGNVPAYIEKTADVTKAVRDVINGKTFDNGTLCSSEQSIVCDEAIRDEVVAEVKANGGYFLNEAETAAVAKVVVTPQRLANPEIVGKPAPFIAEKAGIKVPPETRVLVAPLAGVGRDFPLSIEKLCPVLSFYVVKDWHEGCERCLQLLRYGGTGHTLGIHSRDDAVIREFALKKPVFRIVVNTQTSMGATGYTTGLAPSMSLGCGAYAGNITSDNITPLHLINVKRLAQRARQARGSLHDRSGVLDRRLPAPRPRLPRPPPAPARPSTAPSTSSARTTCAGPCARDGPCACRARAIVTPAARDLAAGHEPYCVDGRAGLPEPTVLCIRDLFGRREVLLWRFETMRAARGVRWSLAGARFRLRPRRHGRGRPPPPSPKPRRPPDDPIVRSSSPRPTPTWPRAWPRPKDGHLNRGPRGVRPGGRRLPDRARRRLRRPAAGRGLPPHAGGGPRCGRWRPWPPGDGFTETPVRARLHRRGRATCRWRRRPASEETRRTRGRGRRGRRPTTSRSS